MSEKVFKTYDDGYVVRTMRPSEVGMVLGWYAQYGDVAKDDLNIAMDIFPNDASFFIGEYEGKPVASRVQLPWGNDIYYGTMYYCETEYRRRHFGSRLRDDVGASHIPSNAVLFVDATKGFVSESNVSKYGYTDLFSSAVYKGHAKVISSKHSYQIKEASRCDFSKLIEFDNDHFVSADNPYRRSFLQRLSNLPSGCMLVATNESGAVIGLAARRPSVHKDHHVIGPIYSKDKDVATALLSSLCSDIVGDIVTIGVWNKNEEAVDMMKSFGFEILYDLVHQRFNGTATVYKPTVFAVTCIHLCGF